MEELAPLKNSSLDISKYENLITFVQDRPGHDLRYAIDARKIQKELGWSPKTFRSGIRKTVKWYVDNQSFTNNLKLDRNSKFCKIKIILSLPYTWVII